MHPTGELAQLVVGAVVHVYDGQKIKWTGPNTPGNCRQIIQIGPVQTRVDSSDLRMTSTVYRRGSAYRRRTEDQMNRSEHERMYQVCK